MAVAATRRVAEKAPAFRRRHTVIVSRSTGTSCCGRAHHCAVFIHTGWPNKPLYIQLLQDRGVPVMDADTMQDAEFSKVAFATVWNPPPGLLDKVICWGQQGPCTAAAAMEHT